MKAKKDDRVSVRTFKGIKEFIKRDFGSYQEAWDVFLFLWLNKKLPKKEEIEKMQKVGLSLEDFVYLKRARDRADLKRRLRDHKALEESEGCDIADDKLDKDIQEYLNNR
jgi:hypothetical protein